MARHSASESGFTLIEMLVALSVFSIAALALLRLDSYAVATAATLGSKQAADLVVHNQAALVLTDPGPVVGGTTLSTVENGGRRFSVQRTVTPTADRRLVRIDLLAIENGTSQRAALTLVKRVV